MNTRGRDELVSILKPTTSQGTAGQVVATFEFDFDLWVEILPRGVAERWLGQATVAQATFIFRAEYRDDIDATKRLEYGGAEYEIVGVEIRRKADQAELLIVAKGPVMV